MVADKAQTHCPRFGILIELPYEARNRLLRDFRFQCQHGRGMVIGRIAMSQISADGGAVSHQRVRDHHGCV